MRDNFQDEDEAGRRFWLFRAGDEEDVNTGAQILFIHGALDEWETDSQRNHGDNRNIPLRETTDGGSNRESHA